MDKKRYKQHRKPFRSVNPKLPPGAFVVITERRYPWHSHYMGCTGVIVRETSQQRHCYEVWFYESQFGCFLVDNLRIVG